MALAVAWTVPVDLAILRESDDPLGFAAAADRLAALMCSPITGRTTSVRQLSIFCWAARTAERGAGRWIHAESFDRASRIFTVSTTAILQEWGSALSLAQRRALILPGRRRAGSVANRYRHVRLRPDDFDRPLLGAEHSQGLWGAYASMARNLGLVEKVGSQSRLTHEGRDWADRFRVTFIPYSKKDWFSSPDITESTKAVDKFTTEFAPRLWPLTDVEREGFFSLLDRAELEAFPRISFLMERAASWSSLPAISRHRRAATLVGVDGTSLAHLAHLASLATQAIGDVEDAYRSRVLDVDSPTPPNLRPFSELISWARGQGLDIGALHPGPISWSSMDRHHASLFRRRGRTAWPDLAKGGMLDIPPSSPRPNYRFSSLRRLAAECLDQPPT